MDWRPIATAPRDGTPFIAWTTENGLELEARFNPEHGHFETYGRVDYDQDDWSEDPGSATHWMLYPEEPSEADTKTVDKELEEARIELGMLEIHLEQARAQNVPTDFADRVGHRSLQRRRSDAFVKVMRLEQQLRAEG